MPRNLCSLKITLPDAASSSKPEQTPRTPDSKSLKNISSLSKQYGSVHAIDATARYYHSLQSKVKDDWHPSILTENCITTWDFACGPRNSKNAAKRNNELMRPNISGMWDASKVAENDITVEDFANGKESASSKEPKAGEEKMKEVDVESARNKGTNRFTLRNCLRRWSSGCSKPKPAEKPSKTHHR